MPMTEALMVAVIGLLVVLAVLAMLAIIIVIMSKILAAITGKKAAPAAAAETQQAAPPATPMKAPANRSAGSVDLHSVDDKTAAMIMAIVSFETGIPLGELCFKSIKALD